MSSALIHKPDRLRLVFERIDRAEDETGQAIAFNLASKALKAAGITWTDLLEAHLAQKGSTTPPISEGVTGFGDIFEGIFSSAFASARRETQPAPQPARAIVSGSHIPETVIGRIKVSDRRPTKNGEMLVVQVENPTHNYGPLVIFSDKDIDKLGASPDAAWFGRVRQPTSERHMPTLYGLRD
jgi:hypothetical protein